MSPLMVLAAIMIGGGMFGIPGMVIGVPVFAIICTIIRNYVGSLLRKKKLPTDHSLYTNVDHVDSDTNEIIYSNTKKDVTSDEVFCFDFDEETSSSSKIDKNGKE